jgi:hypothetical protein
MYPRDSYSLPQMEHLEATSMRTPSPAIPQREELEPRFVPAEIMTCTDRILPERLVLATGELVGPPKPGRSSFADETPQPIPLEIPSDPAAIMGAAEFAPGARPLARRGANHVFIDLSVPMPVTTDWQVQPAPPTLESTATGTAEASLPILPAPHETMRNAGESYTIRAAESGKVISSSDLQPALPSSARNLAGNDGYRASHF